MSWKSLACAGLMGALASPVLAQPVLIVTGGNLVDEQRVWTVSASPDPSLFVTHPTLGTGSALAFELGFRSVGGNFLSVVPNPNPPVLPNPDGTPAPGGGPIEFLNPGFPIFGWEPTEELRPGASFPVGIHVGGQGNDGPAHEAFVALGSTFFTSAGPFEILTIKTQASVTALEWGGAYEPGGTIVPVGTFANGRISQGLGLPGSAENFDIYTTDIMLAARSFLPGDYDGDGGVGVGDLNLVLDNWGAIVPPWPAGWDGDRPSANFIGILALKYVLDSWGESTGSGAALAAAAVPEPSSLVLVGLALVALARLRRREG